MGINANMEPLGCMGPKPSKHNVWLQSHAFPTTTEPLLKSVIARLASKKFAKSGTVLVPQRFVFEVMVLLANERYEYSAKSVVQLLFFTI